MREIMTNKNMYLKFISVQRIRKKISPQNLQVFQILLVFKDFADFQLKLWDPYLSKEITLRAKIFTVSITHQALQDKILLNRFGNSCVFLVETPWNRSFLIFYHFHTDFMWHTFFLLYMQKKNLFHLVYPEFDALSFWRNRFFLVCIVSTAGCARCI